MLKIHLLVIVFFSLSNFSSPQNKTGNVIFIHPDGTSLSDWNALRILTAGPDSSINWDRMSGIGLYQGHIRDRVSSSSNAGATVHANGVKADYNDFGMIDNQIPLSRSGKRMSIMQEAIQKKIFTGLINSGSIIEPGSAVFISSREKRNRYEDITKDVIQSGVDLIFSGGEEWMLPEGVQGRFSDGKRTDGLNLIEWAIENGYKVIYTKDELLNISITEKKILGVFAAIHTFNDRKEEDLLAAGLPNYSESAPRLDEMVKFALKFLSAKGQFFLVAEEEGTDNFGNKNNANGKLEALMNADNAIGEVLKFIETNPNTMLVTAADSDAGGLGIAGAEVKGLEMNTPLPATDYNGAPMDGINGTGTLPFISKPDKTGRTFPFGIVWSSSGDLTGPIVARAHGLNAERMNGKIDNTDIYRMMYLTLFGVWLE
jgi:alkaline phosphatase